MLTILHLKYKGNRFDVSVGDDIKFNNHELLKIANECVPPTGQYQGQGTVDSPITMAGIGAWHHAATNVPTGKHVYYDIGGRMIHRRSNRGSNYNNYLADWGPVDEVQDKARAPTFTGHHKDLRTDTSITSKTGASYPKIYYRLREEITQKQLDLYNPTTAANVAKAVRGLLHDHNAGQPVDPPGAALLAAAWFLAEVCRNKNSLWSGLVLLDFIEKDIRYGGSQTDEHVGSKQFTWERVLWHPDMIDFHTLEGVAEPKDQEKDLFGKDVKLDEWGGKHPMAHTGSEAQAEGRLVPTFAQGGPGANAMTAVQQKEASLLIRWLYHKLKNQTPFESLDWDSVRQGNTLDTSDFNNKSKGYTTLDPKSKQYREAARRVRENEKGNPVRIDDTHRLTMLRVEAKNAIHALIQARMDSESLQL